MWREGRFWDWDLAIGLKLGRRSLTVEIGLEGEVDTSAYVALLALIMFATSGGSMMVGIP